MDHCPGQFCSNKIMKIFKTIFFENSFNNDKYHAQKSPKICTGCRVSAAKIYLYYSSKIAKARLYTIYRRSGITDPNIMKNFANQYQDTQN